jgi:hypothetical protein
LISAWAGDLEPNLERPEALMLALRIVMAALALVAAMRTGGT